MEKIQTNTTKMSNPASYYHKYSCESCNYYTNYKNSYNKHTKSAKHLSLFPTEENVETKTVCSDVVKEDVQPDRETVSEELQTEVVMDASMGFITVEEVKKETKNEDIFPYNEYKLNKIIDLMDKLNNKINDDVEIKCLYFGLGFLFHLVFFNLFIGGQWSNFFELSG